MSLQPPDSDDGNAIGIEPLLVPEVVAAQMLGVSPRAVWQLGKARVITTARIGRRKNYLVSSLKEYVRSITEAS